MRWAKGTTGTKAWSRGGGGCASPALGTSHRLAHCIFPAVPGAASLPCFTDRYTEAPKGFITCSRACRGLGLDLGGCR